MAQLATAAKWVARVLCGCLVIACGAAAAGTLDPPPLLTGPVNDFAGVVDPESRRTLEALIRSLQQASGDVVVVATVETVQPYGDIREYAVEMFENRGRGIGSRDRDNGLLVLVAVKDRQVWIEVGYGLEQFITDGFAGETSRRYMVPAFRRGAYGAGLVAGVTRLVQRIAEGRNVTLTGVPQPRQRRAPAEDGSAGVLLALFVFIAFLLLNALAGTTRRRQRYWGGGPWSGWHSGVGPFGGFGGGWRGGFGGGGGGFGGGFGGFGGGRSGGGGGGASW
jgi:uncharacterized protein